MPTPDKLAVTKLKKHLVKTPARDDLHEQREHSQAMPGVVRRHSVPEEPEETTDVKAKDPVRDPAASTTNEDIERADGEGMVPTPPPRAKHPHVQHQQPSKGDKQ